MATENARLAVNQKKDAKAAIKGAFFSEFVDMFDIYLPTIILTPVLFYFQPAKMSESLTAIFTSLVFITTLLGRPLGAAFFGIVGDKIGRRKATIYSVTGFGVITLLIALLPGYGTIGIVSYWLLVILRFLDGLCLGGGYTGAIPLAIENAEKHKRGLVGGIVLSAFPVAYIAINLLGMLSFAVFELDGADSPYAVYGWRIPFIIGAIFAFALAWYYVRKVPESEAWEEEVENEAKQNQMPLFEVLKGENGKNFLQVFIMMSGFWLTQNVVTAVVPTSLLNFLGLSGFNLTLTMLISYAVLILSYILSGVIGQKIGRKTFFVVIGPVIAVLSSSLFAVLANGKGYSLPLIILLVVCFSVITTSPWGVIPTYINERFATSVRATGFGLGFSAAVVLPSFYAFYMDWLGHLLPYHYTPAALLFLGGIIGMIGALMGPETKDVDF